MLSGVMLYTMWIVVGVVALDTLAGIIKALITRSFSFTKLASFLGQGILPYVLPLLVLAKVVTMDPTGVVAPAMYYIASLGVIVKYLSDAIGKIQKE